MLPAMLMMRFMIMTTASPGESVEEPAAKPKLTPAQWQYPDDCFYIKMYVLCPLQPLQEAFGPCHGYGDEKRGGVGGP